MQPPPQWAEALLSSVDANLPLYCGQSTSLVLVALARLGITPQQAWAARVVGHLTGPIAHTLGPQVSVECVCAHTLGPQVSVECVCVCARLYVSVSVCAPLYVSVSVCAPLYVSVSVCAPLYVSVYVCAPVRECVCVCPPVRVCAHAHVGVFAAAMGRLTCAVASFCCPLIHWEEWAPLKDVPTLSSPSSTPARRHRHQYSGSCCRCWTSSCSPVAPSRPSPSLVPPNQTF